MISRGTRDFWALYHRLSPEARAQARKAFLLFAVNPDHPSLRFKKLHSAYPFWSVRFGNGYRAVCRREADSAEWIWIGTHHDFDKMF